MFYFHSSDTDRRDGCQYAPCQVVSSNLSDEIPSLEQVNTTLETSISTDQSMQDLHQSTHVQCSDHSYAISGLDSEDSRMSVSGEFKYDMGWQML